MSGLDIPFADDYRRNAFWDNLMSGQPVPGFAQAPGTLPGPGSLSVPQIPLSRAPQSSASFLQGPLGAPSSPSGSAVGGYSGPGAPFDFGAQPDPFQDEYDAQPDPLQDEYDKQARQREADTYQRIGDASAIAASITGIAAAISGALVMQEQLKGQARMMEHEAFVANLNARQFERDAAAVKRQARGRIAELTAEAAQIKARQTTAAAARGVEVGVGSARDVTDTTDIAKEVTRVAINRAAVERAGAARMQAEQARGQSLMDRVGARSLRRVAGDPMSPFAAGSSRLISSIGEYAWQRSNYLRRQ